MNHEIRKLLEELSEVCAAGVDCVLQYALDPALGDRYGFESTDPHVVVGAYARRLIRDEDVSEAEMVLAVEAVRDLPRIDDSFPTIIRNAERRSARVAGRAGR